MKCVIPFMMIILAQPFMMKPSYHMTRVPMLSQNNNEGDENTDKPDIIEKYAEWFGLFPKEKKWKNVRFTFYIIIAGYLLGEGVDDLKDMMLSLHDHVQLNNLL